MSLELKTLESAKDNEIRKFMDQAKVSAQKADQYKATLNEMDSWFGLGAVFYGVKKLIMSASIFLIIGTVLYLILRLAATANPIAGSVFSIFEMMFSWVIRLIKGIAPRALEFAGNTATSVFQGYKKTLNQLVDTIELMKEREKATGGVKKYTLDEILGEVSKAMDSDDKDRVMAAKKELQWK
jgi:hypothetical protein